ncbi:MAG: SH3 domain-containing protein [Blastocatellia bacterium]
MAFLLLLVWGATACKNNLLGEAAVVIPERMEVRNSISRVSKTIGELKRGDQVTILERSTQAETAYARIKTADGMEGWADARNLARKANLDKAQELATAVKDQSPQAECRARASIKVRLTPSRANDDNLIALLPKDTMFDVVDRENLPKAATPTTAGDSDKDEAKAKYEVWYKVRVKENPVVPAGYVYGGSVELAVPQEIAYFVHPARKIVGWQKLGTVKDDRGQDNYHYVVFQKAYNNADEKSDFDYFQVVGFDPKNTSVSYYNVLKKEIRGVFPVTVKIEDKRATFEFKSLDSNNQEMPAQFTVTEERGHLHAPRPETTTRARK